MVETSGRLTIIAELSGGPRRMNSPQKWRDLVSNRLIQLDDLVVTERDGVPSETLRACDVPELASIFEELFASPKQEPAAEMQTPDNKTVDPIGSSGGTEPAASSTNELLEPAATVAPQQTPETPPKLAIAVGSTTSAAKIVPPQRPAVSGGRIALVLALITLLGTVGITAILTKSKSEQTAQPPSDPLECLNRMPAGVQSLYIKRNRTPVRDKPTAQENSGSTRIDFKDLGTVVTGEWVPSSVNNHSCWLKLSTGNGYISEINLSSTYPPP